MSTSIYIPYFYIIQHINSGKYYAGVKYGGNANPDQLLKFNGYQTSSNVVKQIIFEEGLESFCIRRLRIFETKELAIEYEYRFLKRVNAAFNDNFLNRSNNSIGTLNINYEKRKQTNLDRYGVSHPSQVLEFNEKTKQTCLERYGVEYAAQSETIKEKKKKTCLENFGCEYPMQSEEVKEKKKQNCLERYGVSHPSKTKEFQDKKKQTCLEKYGVENYAQIPEIKEKRVQTQKQTCLEKYGVENYAQIPEIRSKISNIRINLLNRSSVVEIRKYKEKFNIKVDRNWFYKKQEFLDNMLLELKLTYGELEC